MGQDYFKSAIENARILHRTLMATSVILVTFLLPAIIDEPGNLQTALKKIDAMYSRYLENQYDNIIRYPMGGAVELLLNASLDLREKRPDKFSIMDQARYFTYVDEKGRSLQIEIVGAGKKDLDNDFQYTYLQKKIIELSQHDKSRASTFVSDFVTRSIPYNFGPSGIPPSGRLGFLEPHWLENVSGIFPHQLSNLSDAIRLLYVAQHLRGVSYLYPEYTKAAIKVKDFTGGKLKSLSEINDFRLPPDGLPINCQYSSFSGEEFCKINFFQYELTFDNNTLGHEFGIKSKLISKNYELTLSVPADVYMMRFNPQHTCQILIGSDCNQEEFSELVEFALNSGDIPLNKSSLIGKILHDNKQSVEILGITISGVKWVGLFGSLIIFVLSISLIVNILDVYSEASGKELLVYSEIIPSSVTSLYWSIASVLGLPLIALSANLIVSINEKIYFSLISLCMLVINLICSVFISAKIAALHKIFLNK